MSPRRKPIPEYGLSAVEVCFRLAAVRPDAPAITRDEFGDWSIRVLTHVTLSAGRTVERYDYFRLAPDGTILSAPWGHARDWRPGRIVGLDEQVLAAYAARARGGEPS